MRMRVCPREEAVQAAALDASNAPLGEDLLAHLAACAECRDLHVIASLLHDDHVEALAEARVPSAGQTWWRAELRARQDAAATAARPITMATGLAAACLVGVLASLAGGLVWWLQNRLVVPSAVHALAGTIAAGWGAPTGAGRALWLVLGVLLVATPLVLYVALREE